MVAQVRSRLQKLGVSAGMLVELVSLERILLCHVAHVAWGSTFEVLYLLVGVSYSHLASSFGLRVNQHAVYLV